MSLKVLHEPKSINAAGANTVNCVLLIIHNYSQRILYPLPIIDRTSRPKKKRIIKDMEGLNNQPNLTDIYRKFQLKILEHIFFSITYETPTTIGYILGKKSHDLVIQGTFSDHSRI